MGSGTRGPVSPQSLLAMSPEKRKLAAQEGRPTEPLPEEQPKDKPHTLEEFSYEFFRCRLRPPAGPANTSVILRTIGRPWREVLCPPGLPGKGDPLTLPQLPREGKGE